MLFYSGFRKAGGGTKRPPTESIAVVRRLPRDLKAETLGVVQKPLNHRDKPGGGNSIDPPQKERD